MGTFVQKNVGGKDGHMLEGQLDEYTGHTIGIARTATEVVQFT